MRHKIFIISIFLIGFLLRLYVIFHKPLWLDEVYSLYFASNFSALQIIFRLHESQPGLFYLILKGLINISLNPIFLRLIVATIPEIIGCYLIQKHFKKPILTAIFLLNPFFIYYAWQIRMYSLVFLLTIIIFIQIKKNYISPIKFIILLLIANLISYSFIFPTSCLLLYLAITRRQSKWLLIIPLIIVEFFVFKGPFYKSYAELASWIYPPSFLNIPNTILTSLGLNFDLNSQNNSPVILSIFFYLFFGSFIIHQSKKSSLFFYAYTLPLLVTILVSIAFPFLSQHRFFYLFVPKVSLFISRFLIPFSVVFYIFLYKAFPHPLLLILLIPFWIKTNSVINFTLPSPLSTSLQQQMLFPPWENLRLQNNFSRTDLKTASKNYNEALKTETQLLQLPPDCTLFRQFPYIKYTIQPIKSLDNYEKQIQNAILICSKSL